MCTREYAHQMLQEIQQPEQILDLEINVAWLQITLSEIFLVKESLESTELF